MNAPEYLRRRSPRSGMTPLDRIIVLGIIAALPLPWLAVAWWLS